MKPAGCLIRNPPSRVSGRWVMARRLRGDAAGHRGMERLAVGCLSVGLLRVAARESIRGLRSTNPLKRVSRADAYDDLREVQFIGLVPSSPAIHCRAWGRWVAGAGRSVWAS